MLRFLFYILTCLGLPANDIKIEIPRNQLLTLKEIEANQYKWLSKQQQETILKHQKKTKGSGKAQEQESNI